MKAAFIPYSTSAPLLPYRRGLGFRITAVVPMSGNREPDPDPLPLQTALNEQDPKSGVAADAPPPKKEAQDFDTLQKQLGEPPEKPLPGDCCGSGCVRCVWDIYFEDLELYNSRKAALDALRASR